MSYPIISFSWDSTVHFNNIHTTKTIAERASTLFGAGYYRIHPVCRVYA